MSESPTISIAEAQFTDRIVNGKYHVQMPKFLADEGRWDNWECARFESMESLLKKGDVLFDVGAETGAMSAIYAQFIGPENIVLFEPNPDNWQNIKATWDVMGFYGPKWMYCGLVGDGHLVPQGYRGSMVWPPSAATGRIWMPRSFRYLHEHADTTPQISLDDFVWLTRIEPKAITIDVEGAELLVLKGAERILTIYRPLVWCSLHPPLAQRDYGYEVLEVDLFMRNLRYKVATIAEDHEIHQLYEPL